MSTKRPSRIAPVPVPDLAECRATGEMDKGIQEILRAEKEYVNAYRRKFRRPEVRDDLTAICISGGGIRSATFATGVLQALAAHDLLRSFDYLSTVSGGGYIGSSLTWLLSDQARRSDPHPPHFDISPEKFPFGTENSDPRAVGSGEQRNSVDQIKMYQYLKSHGKYLTPGKGIGAASLVAVIIRGMFMSLLVTISLTGLLFTILILAHETQIKAFETIRIVAVAVFAVLAVLTVVYALTSQVGVSMTESQARYRFRRAYDKYAGIFLTLASVLLAIGFVPLVHISVGLAALITGMTLAVILFLLSTGRRPRSIPFKTIAPLTTALVFSGVFIVSHRVAGWSLGYVDPWAGWKAWPPLVLLAVAILIGRFVNLNYVSIHRYYRDRLMESFMPDFSSVKEDATGPARAANSARMSELISADDPKGPYHILNTNLNLSGADSRLRRVRGGDSFILSPMYCGSGETGWRRTDEFLRNGLTLATAMAVSGAAVEPNSGPDGTGVTRRPSLSMLMTLLNLTLGFWIPHPLRRQNRIRFPHYLNPGLYSLVTTGYNSRRQFLELGDGGHFENLGIYEMIRRRARLIVASVAGVDPTYRFDDLLNALRKIYIDFGVKILFERNGKSVNPTHMFNLPDGALPTAGHLIGRIEYANGSSGILILLKASLIEDLDFSVLAVKERHPDFPNQSTADQSYDEELVDVYARLGYEVARRMIVDVGEQTFRTPSSK